MENHRVRFWSEGVSISGWWRTPSEGTGPWPAIVQGPGWFGSKDAAVYRRYHEYFTSAGFAVLVIDYRGFGDSDGSPGYFSPWDQLIDLMNSVTYVETRRDAEPGLIAAFGTGATGGGNVVMLSAADPRVAVSVAQFPIADGARWLEEMRSDEEWASFQKRLNEDRRRRVSDGRGDRVDPHRDIMIAPPERARREFKKELRSRMPQRVPLSAADAVLCYRPLDVAPTVDTPILFIAVEGDEATPEWHAERLHDAVAGPKRLIMQQGTSHYASYEDRADVVLPAVVSWYTEHLECRLPEHSPPKPTAGAR